MSGIKVREFSNIEGDMFLAVITPFNREYVNRVKSLGASWDSVNKEWVVPFDMKEDLYVLLQEVYGYGQDKVDMIIYLKGNSEQCGLGERSYDFKGRGILFRYNRDSGVKLQEGVSLLKGDISDFGDSGGSNNYPQIFTMDYENANSVIDVELLVRGVPKSQYEDVIQYNNEFVSYSIRDSGDGEIVNKYMDYSLLELVSIRDDVLAAIASKEA